VKTENKLKHWEPHSKSMGDAKISIDRKIPGNAHRAHTSRHTGQTNT